MMADMIIAFSMIFVIALLDGAFSDIREFRIRNRVPLILIVSFVGAWGFGFDAQAWLGHLGAAGLLLVIGAGLFALGVWGGGDAKMLPATVLWVGFEDMSRFLLVMALVGGGLAALALIARRASLGPAGPVRAWGERLAATGHVPYGVAIAAGGIDWWFVAMFPRFGG